MVHFDTYGSYLHYMRNYLLTCLVSIGGAHWTPYTLMPLTLLHVHSVWFNWTRVSVRVLHVPQDSVDWSCPLHFERLEPRQDELDGHLAEQYDYSDQCGAVE